MIDLGRIPRILVIGGHFVGDALLTTPVLRALRTSFPEAFISYLTAAPLVLDILRSNPDVDEFLLSTKSAFKYISRLRPFDLALDLLGSQTAQLVCLLSGARYRVGMGNACPVRGLQPYNIARPEVSERDDVITQYVSLTKALGLPDLPRKTILILDDDERNLARAFLHKHGIGPEDLWVALQPGKNQVEPPWSAEKFVALGKKLRENLGHPILVIQGPDDRTPIAEEVHRRLGGGAILVSGLPIRRYGAVLEQCALLVTSEGGAGHIAAALRVKSIVLFTTPTASVWFPYRPEDGMIALEELPGQDLSVENVARAAEGLLRRASSIQASLPTPDF
jgi:ADP-heptose:LPS heptosyltransferase